MKRYRRISLFPALVGLVCAGLVAAGAIRVIRAAVHDRFVERVRAETALVAAEIERSSAGPAQAFAERAARSLGLRITLVGADGTVLGDSARFSDGVPQMENHLHRPEIQEARTSGIGEAVRHSESTGETYFYSARRVSGEGPIEYVRAALPVERMTELQSHYAWLVVLVVLGAAAVVLVAAGFVARRLSRPVEWLYDTAERIANGEFDLELPALRGPEAARFSEALRQIQRALLVKIAELDSERRVLSSVIGGMQEGLLVVGRDRRIRLANAAVPRIFDLDFDPVGHLLAEVVRHPTVIESVEGALNEGRGIEAAVFQLPGAGRTFELHATPLPGDAPGQIDAVLALLIDITRLERLESVRREFVANVSHELRTPLTSIKASVETLLETEVEDARSVRRFLEVIRKHADRMGDLIEDLTDLSLIETGAIRLEMRPVTAADVARDVVEQLAARSSARAVGLTSSVPEDLVLRADRRRLEQMLSNLVDNAVKFTRAGGHVAIRGGVIDGRPSLIVEDDGIGIPGESREKIFNRFYQVDRGQSRELGGTGLGLSIVKHLMRLHGGRVLVDSEVGVGSTFTLQFPAEESAVASAAS